MLQRNDISNFALPSFSQHLLLIETIINASARVNDTVFLRVDRDKIEKADVILAYRENDADVALSSILKDPKNLGEQRVHSITLPKAYTIDSNPVFGSKQVIDALYSAMKAGKVIAGDNTFFDALEVQVRLGFDFEGREFAQYLDKVHELHKTRFNTATLEKFDHDKDVEAIKESIRSLARLSKRAGAEHVVVILDRVEVYVDEEDQGQIRLFTKEGDGNIALHGLVIPSEAHPDGILLDASIVSNGLKVNIIKHLFSFFKEEFKKYDVDTLPGFFLEENEILNEEGKFQHVFIYENLDSLTTDKLLRTEYIGLGAEQKIDNRKVMIYADRHIFLKEEKGEEGYAEIVIKQPGPDFSTTKHKSIHKTWKVARKAKELMELIENGKK